MEAMGNQGNLIWTKFQLILEMAKKFTTEGYKLITLSMGGHIGVRMKEVVLGMMSIGIMHLTLQLMLVVAMEAMEVVEAMVLQLEASFLLRVPILKL